MTDIQILEPYLTVIRHTMLIRQYLQAEDARMAQETHALLLQMPQAAMQDPATIQANSLIIRLGEEIFQRTQDRRYVQSKDAQLADEILQVLERQYSVAGHISVDLATGLISVPDAPPGTVSGVPQFINLDVHQFPDALAPAPAVPDSTVLPDPPRAPSGATMVATLTVTGPNEDDQRLPVVADEETVTSPFRDDIGPAGPDDTAASEEDSTPAEDAEATSEPPQAESKA